MAVGVTSSSERTPFFADTADNINTVPSLSPISVFSLIVSEYTVCTVQRASIVLCFYVDTCAEVLLV